METHCISCKKNTANKNYSFRRTKHNRLMIVLNCAIRRNLASLKIKKQSDYQAK